MEDSRELALLTDLYELTMAQAYFQNRRAGSATFSLFVRGNVKNRGYYVAAGLEDALDFLAALAFDGAGIDYLYTTRIFAGDFLDYLKPLRFTGSVRALPEGRLFFADEPILEVTAPIVEAQIVETFLINQINLQSMIATKAARCVTAAGGRGVVDFALRRTHGIDAGMKVARASYIAGCAGTSNVLAGKQYGIPVVGTMAHSFISSFEREIDAFRAYAESFPDGCVLLLDTYDPIAGAKNAVAIARELAARGKKLLGARIDSGDLATLAGEVRRIFDNAGFPGVQLIASGGLDEYDIAEFTAKNVPFNAYGVGTQMGTSGDQPWLDTAYKLVEADGRPVLKLSRGKASMPGQKQIFRRREGVRLKNDVLGLAGEKLDGEPLLQTVMENGRLTGPHPALGEIRERFRAEFALLDESVKAVRAPKRFPVEISAELRRLRDRTVRRVRGSESTA
ncbi:MAG TPA: nicotinate phosphoribosyltransferase [Candidatus Binatia bacterium]